MAAAAERFNGFFSVTRSQVYRAARAGRAGAAGLEAGARSSQQCASRRPARAFKAWLNTAGPDNVRSPLILRLVYSGSLTPRQRANLVQSAREQYVEQLDEARARAKAADNPYEKAAADFTVAYNRAVIKMLDAIPE